MTTTAIETHIDPWVTYDEFVEATSAKAALADITARRAALVADPNALAADVDALDAQSERLSDLAHRLFLYQCSMQLASGLHHVFPEFDQETCEAVGTGIVDSMGFGSAHTSGAKAETIEMLTRWVHHMRADRAAGNTIEKALEEMRAQVAKAQAEVDRLRGSLAKIEVALNDPALTEVHRRRLLTRRSEITRPSRSLLDIGGDMRQAEFWLSSRTDDLRDAERAATRLDPRAGATGLLLVTIYPNRRSLYCVANLLAAAI